MSKGLLARSFWVTCGRCLSAFEVGDMSCAMAEALIVRAGYRLTRQYGWICSSCAAVYREIVPAD